jgi:ComF family protein
MKYAELLQGLGELVFPPRCTVCQGILPPGRSTAFCVNCRRGFEPVESPLCRVCGRILFTGTGNDSLCGGCLRRPPAYTVARSMVRYKSSVRSLVHQLKYGKDLTVLRGISEIVRCFDMQIFSRADLVMPVPLHPVRLRKRGWNQSVILAELFFPENKNRLRVDWLVKLENTEEQTGLSGKRRRLNLKSVFALGKKAQPRGSVICLVDDVFTTGTTVHECSKVLRRAGAKEILVLTLARADVPGRDWQSGGDR